MALFLFFCFCFATIIYAFVRFSLWYSCVSIEITHRISHKLQLLWRVCVCVHVSPTVEYQSNSWLHYAIDTRVVWLMCTQLTPPKLNSTKIDVEVHSCAHTSTKILNRNCSHHVIKIKNRASVPLEITSTIDRAKKQHGNSKRSKGTEQKKHFFWSVRVCVFFLSKLNAKRSKSTTIANERNTSNE